MRHGELRGPHANGRINLSHAFHTACVVTQRRVVAQIVAAHGVHEAFENAVAIACNQHITLITTAVGIAGCNAGQCTARCFAHRTKRAVLGQQTFHAVEDGFVQSHVNHLALTAFLALVQRHQNANHPVQRSQCVANTHAHTHGHAAWLGSEMTQTTHGLGHHTKAWLVAIRPCLPIAADAQHDEARVDSQQFIRAEAPALHRAWAEVFDQHIRVFGELTHDVLCFFFFQVQRHRAFVARLHLPPHGRAVFEQTPFTKWVARLWGFNLHHIRTKVGQCFGGKGACDELAEFDHTQAMKWGLV